MWLPIPKGNGALLNAGAVYLYNGQTNALVAALTGSNAGDSVGNGGVTILINGNYVVRSSYWRNGSHVDAGAVTLGSGATGISGSVSAANSLVGTQRYDEIGYGVNGVTALSDGNYIVNSARWQNGIKANAGAVTLGNGFTGTTGIITTCNSVIGNVINGTLNAAYNDTYAKLLVAKPSENIVTLFSPSQTALSMSTTTATSGVSPNAVVSFVNDSCKLIGTLKSSGTAPVQGSIKAAVYIKSITPSTPTSEAYCRRHYRILPADSADFKTATVTLYFTQAELDDYNAAPGITDKLPQNPTDAAGKVALRITQQRGTSPTGAFGSFTGFSGSGPASVLLIPGDSNVVWNAPLSRWEVSFPVTGFGGFFLSAGNDNPLSLPAVTAGKANGITVSPIPAGNTITIINSNAALAGNTITALNLQGQVMATAKLESSTQMDIQNWPAGIYMLKFRDGSVVKVVKQ